MRGWEIIWLQNQIRIGINKEMPNASPAEKLAEYSKRVEKLHKSRPKRKSISTT